jgi:hypothetical protein
MLLCIRSALILATASSVAAKTIAGYETLQDSNVTEHLMIDLDVQIVIAQVSEPNLGTAFAQYRDGNNHQPHEVSPFEAFFYSDFSYHFISSHHHNRW